MDPKWLSGGSEDLSTPLERYAASRHQRLVAFGFIVSMPSTPEAPGMLKHPPSLLLTLNERVQFQSGNVELLQLMLEGIS